MDLIQYNLDNGIRVILQPTSSAPVVALNVWVGVGSADEDAREAGLAHVHEHMLFKGTARRGVGQIAREVEAAGGHINAFTSFDQTCYYVVLSSRYAEAGLDILADAIRSSSFDADELGRELEVIQEEIKRGKDSPSMQATLRLFEEAYQAHPYRLPIIGTSESVDAFAREDVLNFFHKHYVPSNITVVAVGDLDEAQARDMINRAFGDWQAPTHTPVIRAQEPAQEAMRVAVAHEGAQDCYLRVGFHIPPAVHEDIAALEVLGNVLGSGESSLLYQAVQRERELVHGVWAGPYTPRESGLFMIAADYQLLEADEPGPGARSDEEVIQAVMEVVFSLTRVDADEEDVARARTQLESQSVYSKQTIEGLAMKYGHYAMVTGDPTYEREYYEALAAVNAARVREVAARYLTPQNCTVVLTKPQEAALPATDALNTLVREAWTQAQAQAPAPRAPITASPERAAPAEREVVEVDGDGFAVVKLAPDVTLVVQEDHAVELFSARALTLGGLRLEDASNNGVNALLSELLLRGTPSRDAVSIAREVERMAASLGGMSGRNTFGLSMSGLSRTLEPCLELFSECWLEPTLPEEELERERRQHLQQLRSRLDSLETMNFELFAKTFFGDHPYGLPSSGSEASVATLTREATRGYLDEVIRTQPLVLSVVGDVDAGQVADVMRQRFGAAYAAPRTGTQAPPAPQRERGPRLVTGALDKNQAHILVGFDAPLLGSPQRDALEVLTSILSGQGGRLFYELRDRQSLAYSVYASSMLGLEASAFLVSIGTSPEKINQAVAGILSEIRKLREVTITAEELAVAQRYLAGNHDIGLQRNGSRSMSMALDELYGLGYRHTFSYGDRIAAVTLEDVQALIDEHLRLEDVVVAITRPASVEVPDSLLSDLL